jgi:Rod binding domain-containing protein
MSVAAAPGLSADALLRLAAPQTPAPLAPAGSDGKSAPRNPKAFAAAQDFEAVFLSSMFQQMFTGIDGEGPFGGGPGIGVWRSFLTDQFAKSFAKAGGVGIAAHVYDTLLQHQGARTP